MPLDASVTEAPNTSAGIGARIGAISASALARSRPSSITASPGTGMLASTRRTRALSCWRSPTATFVATVDLPLPPAPE